MTKLKLLAATAIATALIAAPAMAKDATHDHKTVKTQKHKASKTDKQSRMEMRNRMQQDASYERGFNNGFDRRAAMDRDGDRAYTTKYDNRGYDSGFWPADVAGGIVGGAVDTAGAIATAPFRDTYAAYDGPYESGPIVRSTTINSGWNDTYYDSGWNNNWNNNWARRQAVQEGGFACTPGTYYTNSYGNTVLCQ